MISNATNHLRESRKESLLTSAGSTSICEWLVCDLVMMCLQAVGDRALGDHLCIYMYTYMYTCICVHTHMQILKRGEKLSK